jgi:hypothetical protein
MERALNWRKALFPLGVVLLLGLGLLLRLYTVPVVVIEGPTELLYKPEVNYEMGNVLSTPQAGDRGKLLWVRYSKDAKFSKIYLSDGRLGYVMDGGNFRLVSAGEHED